jgi:hypothetical protein
VLGAAPSIAAGEYIQASGTWENHREHGLQFRAAFLRVTAPTSAEGMEKYLGSGLIKGIGPTFAQRLRATRPRGIARDGRGLSSRGRRRDHALRGQRREVSRRRGWLTSVGPRRTATTPSPFAEQCVKHLLHALGAEWVEPELACLHGMEFYLPRSPIRSGSEAPVRGRWDP